MLLQAPAVHAQWALSARNHRPAPRVSMLGADSTAAPSDPTCKATAACAPAQQAAVACTVSIAPPADAAAQKQSAAINAGDNSNPGWPRGNYASFLRPEERQSVNDPGSVPVAASGAERETHAKAPGHTALSAAMALLLSAALALTSAARPPAAAALTAPSALA